MDCLVIYYCFTFWLLMKPCVHCLAIAQLLANGEKTSRIAAWLKAPLWIVQKIIIQKKSIGNVHVKKKLGRSPSVNIWRIHIIIKKRITQNKALSLNSIAKSSRQSVHNIVKNFVGLRSYHLCHRQHLSNNAKLKSRNKMQEDAQTFQDVLLGRCFVVEWENLHHWEGAQLSKWLATDKSNSEKCKKKKNCHATANFQRINGLGRCYRYGKKHL